MDVAPKQKTTPRQRIAQIVRMFGTTERGVRTNAWRALEHTMASTGVDFNDVGNWIEHSYSEDEMLEMVATIRKEEQARAPQRNGHIMLPEAAEMAEYCHERLNRLKNDKQRDFVTDMYVITQRGMNLSLGRLGYLASIYIQIGGRI